jgi:hypothetical protein
LTHHAFSSFEAADGHHYYHVKKGGPGEELKVPTLLSMPQKSPDTGKIAL